MELAWKWQSPLLGIPNIHAILTQEVIPQVHRRCSRVSDVPSIPSTPCLLDIADQLTPQTTPNGAEHVQKYFSYTWNLFVTSIFPPPTTQNMVKLPIKTEVISGFQVYIYIYHSLSFFPPSTATRHHRPPPPPPTEAERSPGIHLPRARWPRDGQPVGSGFGK